MLKRKIQTLINQYFSSKADKILIIDGARQIGKSYIIREEAKRIFPNYIEINMAEDKQGDKLFDGVGTVSDFYFSLSTIAGEKMGGKDDTLVFIDEIQEYPQFLTLLKFLKDDDRFTYIASGSLLGITLHKTLSQPGGRIQIERMFPLDFEEFLWANNFNEEAVLKIKEYCEAQKTLPSAIHERVMNLFKRYLLVGGLPDAVNKYLESENIVEARKIHDQIHDLYREDAARYDIEHSLHIARVYDLIPSNMENRKKRVVYKDIEGKEGKRSSEYVEEFEYLIHSGIALEVGSISNPKFPLIQSEKKNLLKLYMNDVGLLTNVLYRYNASAVLKDMESINLGSVYETVVASELIAHGYNLYYYDNKSKGEVDFLVDDYDSLSAVPIEVKSGKDYSLHTALDKFINNKDYNIQKGYVLSNSPEVRVEGKLTYLPIYYVMFFTPSTPK